MPGLLRRSIFAVPFGCLVAIATHFVRFGDEHAFGGSGNEALVAVALGGSITIAAVILHAFLTGGTTRMTGSLAANRMRALVPRAPALFALGAFVYYGIETLEGNGIELGLPTLVLAAFAAVLAFCLQRAATAVASFVADFVRDWLARLDRRERRIWQPALCLVPIHSQIDRSARRLGRAPPNGRRFR